MQIIQSFHRRRFRLLTTSLYISAALSGMTWADPVATTPASTPTSTSAPATSAAKPAAPAKTAASKSAPASSKSTAATQPAVIKLPPIVVTAATRNPQAIDTTATTTTVLTNKDLDDHKYSSLPDALQDVQGVMVIPYGMPGSTTSVFIHGLDSRQTLVTIDGRRQSDGASGADDNLANLTLDNVNQVEVVRTPITSVQGGGAMGGVINLVTLSGKGVATPQGSVSEEAGSFNTFRESAQSLGQVGNFDYAIAGSRQDSSYPALNSDFTGQADQYRNTTLRGNFGYQITPDIYVDLHSAYSDAYSNSPGEYTDPDPTASILIEDWNLSPEIVIQATDFWRSKFYYTHDQQRQAYNDPYNVALADLYDYSAAGDVTRLQINTDSIDWQNDFQIAHNWNITAGLQGDNRDYYLYDDNLGYRSFEGNDNNLGGYVSSQWQPLDGLNVLNSVRYDTYSEFGGTFNWRQAASYKIAPTQTVVHASISRAFTQPSIADRLDTYISAPPYPSYYANPDLKPETDIGWEAGVEQPLWDGRVTPSLTYFHNSENNYIGNVTQPDGNYMLENIGHVTTEGVEAGLQVKPWSTVTASVNYTYLNAVDDSTQTRLVRRPRNTVQFTGTWQPIDPLTFTMGGIWVVGQQDAVYDATTGLSPQIEIPDYFLLRASATYKINDHVSIWVRGENLTDRNYQPVYGYFGPSMAGYGGIKISF